MAAPGSVYSPKLWYKYDSSITPNHNGLLIQLPRALQQYAIEANTTDPEDPPTYDNLTPIQKTTYTDTWFTTAFHLDKVTHYNYTYTPSGSNSPATMYCLCGWLQDTVNGTTNHTDNWNLHNMTNARNGKPRLTTTETISGTTYTRNYVLCNDGGLNTRAWAEFSNYSTESHDPVSPLITATRRRLVFRMNYRNAYYVYTYKMQVQVQILTSHTGLTPSIATQTFDIPGIETAQRVEVFGYGNNNPFIATIPLSDTGTSWPDFDTGSTFKMRLITKNPEGDYTTDWSSTFTVTDEPDTFTIYRLDDPSDASTMYSDNNLSKNPTSGIAYEIIVVGGYTAFPNIQPTDGMWRPAVHEETGYSGDYNYPTLYNLIGGDPWATPVVCAAVSAGTERTVSFQIYGAPAGGNPAETLLAPGMYAGFPTVYPYDRDNQNVDPSIYRPIPHNSYDAGYGEIPIVYVNNTGHPFKWKASTYNSGGGGSGGGGGSTTTPMITDITLEVGETGMYSSSASYNSQDMHLNYTIYPYMTVSGQGFVSIPIRCRIYKMDGGSEVTVAQHIQTVQIDLGATPQTDVPVLIYQGQEDQRPGDRFTAMSGYIEIGMNDVLDQGIYFAELSVIDTGNWDGGRQDPDKISPEPESGATWQGYPFVDPWDIYKYVMNS